MKNFRYALSTVVVFVGVQMLASGCLKSGAFEVLEEKVTARELVYDDEIYDSEDVARSDAQDGTGGGSAYWVTYEWDPERNAWVNVDDPNDCRPFSCRYYDKFDERDDDNGGHGGHP